MANFRVGVMPLVSFTPAKSRLAGAYFSNLIFL